MQPAIRGKVKETLCARDVTSFFFGIQAPPFITCVIANTMTPPMTPPPILSLQILNVDLSHIEARVADLLKHDRSLVLLRGELIER